MMHGQQNVKFHKIGQSDKPDLKAAWNHYLGLRLCERPNKTPRCIIKQMKLNIYSKIQTRETNYLHSKLREVELLIL